MHLFIFGLGRGERGEVGGYVCFFVYVWMDGYVYTISTSVR